MSVLLFDKKYGGGNRGFEGNDILFVKVVFKKLI